jgi:hypothetical protein
MRCANWWTVPALAGLVLAGCAGSPSGAGGDRAAATTSVNPMDDGAPLTESFDPSRFSASSAVVDNPYFPLEPGTRHYFTGSANIDGTRMSTSVEFFVTDLVKTIQGVTARAIWEVDYTADQGRQPVESELAFYAQDTTGTVWQLGQYPEEYEDGLLTGTPTWITGYKGAVAGIAMPAHPKVGRLSYSQGWGPQVDWTDRARIAKSGERVCVPVGCYDDTIVVEEFNRDSPDAWQLKYHARGTGSVKVGWRGSGDEDHEVLNLVEDVRLTPAQMADLRASALALEASAYEHSPDVYGQTPPLQPRR